MTSLIWNRLRRTAQNAERGWPTYLFGGRVRTSTVVLIVAFLVFWWLYDDHREASRSTPSQSPSAQVVPPGFVPDPNYTWVPRSRVQAPPSTVTMTQTPTTTLPPPMTTATTTAPPLIPPIVLPPPFGAPTTPTAPTPAPGPAPPPLVPGIP